MKNKIKSLLSIVVSLVVLFSLSGATEAVSSWTQVGEDGFGNANNVISYTTGTVINDEFYVTMVNTTDGGSVWRSEDGTSFTKVWTDGFGDTNNTGFYGGASYENYLYMFTANSNTGTEVWRCAESSGCDDGDWTQVNTDGFGDANNIGGTVYALFDEDLYVANANNTTGAEIWRTLDGTTWEQVNTDGFGDANNRAIYTLLSFNSYLYAFTQNTTDGAEVWRCAESSGCDDGDWTQVNTDGFGDSGNILSIANSYDGKIYVGTTNSSGGQLFTSTNGTTWTEVTGLDLMDSEVVALYPGITVNGYMYMGTQDSTNGGSLWRTSDGTNWTVDSTDGFGSVSNDVVLPIKSYSGYVYAGTRDETNGGSLWRVAEPEAVVVDTGDTIEDTIEDTTEETTTTEVSVTTTEITELPQTGRSN